MNAPQCIFGHGVAVVTWTLSEPRNIKQYKEDVYLCKDCYNEIIRLAGTLGYADAPFMYMVQMHDALVSAHSLSCVICLFEGTRSIEGLYWCAKHYQTAEKVAQSTGETFDLLSAVQRFLWKLQLECEECKEDTNRCPNCAECECEGCDHWCSDCNEFVRGFSVCGDCGVRSCSSCASWCGDCGTCTDCCHSCRRCGECTSSASWCGDCGTCTDCCHSCRRCGECTSSGECDCGHDSESDVAVGDWGLPIVFKLHQAAATFYTLATMAERDPSYKQEFENYAKELAEVFAPYLDMAVGGEIRYGSETIGDGEAKRLMPRIHKRYRKYGNINRGKAWAEWKTLRDEYGTDILREAEYALEEGKWGRSVGGHAWAQVAATLRQFEEGEISVVTFVDAAFALEHNNGCVFNKLWTTKGLQDILDANLNGEIDYVERHLPEEAPHTKRYRAWKQFGHHTFR